VNLPFPVIPSLRPTTGSPPTAHCLAIALASLEWEKHQRTRPIEYIAHASGQPLYSPNLSTAISLYELVKRWAQFCVLDEKFGSARDGIEQRSKMKQLLVDTAQVFHALQAYRVRSPLTTLTSRNARISVTFHRCVPL
jgi:hypothetical protein